MKMRITKRHLNKIIKEEIEAEKKLLKAIEGLADKIEELDVSVDFLSAAFVGQDPVSVGAAQKTLGRVYRAPPAAAPRRAAGQRLVREADVPTTYNLKLVPLQENFILEATGGTSRDQILRGVVGGEPTDEEEGLIEDLHKIISERRPLELVPLQVNFILEAADGEKPYRDQILVDLANGKPPSDKKMRLINTLDNLFWDS
jgi:hypothetical protein